MTNTPNTKSALPSSPVSELVEALRECAEMVREGKCEMLSEFWHDEAAKLTAEACAEAAERLTSLEAENARLRGHIVEVQKILCGPQDEMVRLVRATITLAQAITAPQESN